MSVFDFLDATKRERRRQLFRHYEYDTISNYRYEYSRGASIYVRKSQRAEREPARIRRDSYRNFPSPVQRFLEQGRYDVRDYIVEEDRIEALIILLRIERFGIEDRLVTDAMCFLDMWTPSQGNQAQTRSHQFSAVQVLNLAIQDCDKEIGSIIEEQGSHLNNEAKISWARRIMRVGLERRALQGFLNDIEAGA